VLRATSQTSPPCRRGGRGRGLRGGGGFRRSRRSRRVESRWWTGDRRRGARKAKNATRASWPQRSLRR